MSSEKFENLEEDYRILYDDLKRKIDTRIPRCSGEEKKQLTREVERGLEEATELLQDMEAEARPAPGTYRTQMNQKVRNFRRDLDKLKRDLKRVSGSGGRDDLFTGGTYQRDNLDNEISSMHANQRTRLIQGTESLNRASGSLDRTHRIAAETDEIGVGIIEELGGQKDQLLSTRDKMNQKVRNFRRDLDKFSFRVMTNKMILMSIILAELAILGVVIWWKFFSKK
ncbi:vesicle transport through interaction with t-SNAREs homolog 1B-like [Anneissia japonica]|uniref:vesicle transport through interaction with t-SNAREs homolog 1B-like n=1 Tax=Anneissia japonica TaxID=1529436 RepID=UPI001425A5C6|nr:vesicle transport through interaction with t-SNAREs homolog 1B-like [Anneissia japonica]